LEPLVDRREVNETEVPIEISGGGKDDVFQCRIAKVTVRLAYR